jgi:predicted esterase YcpF (UPF0227 family)
MVAHYAGAHQHVIEGSDHAVSEFEQYVDAVLDFCAPSEPGTLTRALAGSETGR